MDHSLFAQMSALDDSPVIRENFVRGPMPYIGAKGRSLEHILQHLPVLEVWVDAFGGSGVVTLNRKQSNLDVFNDTHAGVAAFYRCMTSKEKQQALVERLIVTVHSRELFIYCKETWEDNQLDDVERAARWYYSVIYSFSGKGAAFGRSLSPKIGIAGKIFKNLPLFEEIHQRFCSVQVENLDYRTLIKDYDSDESVFYLDPPYYDTHAYKHNLTKAEHIELCERIFQMKGFVALSGYSNPVYESFPWDKKFSWSAHVSATSKAVNTDTSNVLEVGSDNAEECLWIKENY